MRSLRWLAAAFFLGSAPPSVGAGTAYTLQSDVACGLWLCAFFRPEEYRREGWGEPMCGGMGAPQAIANMRKASQCLDESVLRNAAAPFCFAHVSDGLAVWENTQCSKNEAACQVEIVVAGIEDCEARALSADMSTGAYILPGTALFKGVTHLSSFLGPAAGGFHPTNTLAGVGTNTDEMFANTDVTPELFAKIVPPGWEADVESAVGMFAGAVNFTGFPAGNSYAFDRLADATEMFAGAATFDADTSTWLRGGRLWATAGMFDGAAGFGGRGLGGWDMSGVRDTTRMFAGTGRMNALHLADWRVSAVTSMRQMFDGSDSTGASAGLGSWDVSAVRDMSAMFRNASSWTAPLAWGPKTRAVHTMAEMFANARLFSGAGLEGWEVGHATRFDRMFFDAVQMENVLGSWHVQRATKVTDMFGGAVRFGQSVEGFAGGDWACWEVRNAEGAARIMGPANTLSAAELDMFGSGFCPTRAFDLLVAPILIVSTVAAWIPAFLLGWAASSLRAGGRAKRGPRSQLFSGGQPDGY